MKFILVKRFIFNNQKEINEPAFVTFICVSIDPNMYDVLQVNIKKKDLNAILFKINLNTPLI